MTTQILHNPRCSKSRQTLQLLQDNGITPEVIEYLKTPPTADALKAIVHKLGVNIRDILRVKEAEYKAAGMDEAGLSDDALIEKIIANPKVIERPIVIYGDKAAIGRPPENVLSILPLDK